MDRTKGALYYVLLRMLSKKMHPLHTFLCLHIYNIHIYTRSMLGIWNDIFQDAENGQSLTKPYSRLSLGHFLLWNPGWSGCILPMRMTFAVLSCYPVLWLQVGHMNKCDSHNITLTYIYINKYILETSHTSLQPMSPSRSLGRSDKTSRQASVQSSWVSRYSTTRSPPFRKRDPKKPPKRIFEVHCFVFL